MGRNSQRGQMIIEAVFIVLMFTGLFLIAIGITENGEKSTRSYQFQSKGPRK